MAMDHSDEIKYGDIVRSKSCGDIGLVLIGEKVQWLHQKCIQKLLPDDLILLDRNLYPGDIVVDSKNIHNGQAGIIIDINLSVDLLHPEGSIIEGVDSRELVSIMDYRTGEEVVLGTWKGQISDFIVDVTVKFDNGTVLLIEEACASVLEPMVKVATQGNSYPPGSRVKLNSNPGINLAKLGLKLGIEGTITKATITDVDVHWELSAARANGSPPCNFQSPDKIKRLPFFSHGCWAPFNWCYLSPTAQLSLLQENKGWKKTQLCDPLNPFFIVNARRRFDVLWHDGTIGKQIDSTSLIDGDNSPALLFGEFSIFPEQFVCRAITNNCCDLGIVRSVNIKEHTAQVTWLKKETENNEGATDETVSLLEIERHPECGYLCRDVVSWLPPISSSSAHSDLPRIGMIIGIKNGDIEVSWADGTVSKVGPQEINWIPRDDTKICHEEGETFGISWRKFGIFSAHLVILAYFSRLFCRLISLLDRILIAPSIIHSVEENKLQGQTHGSMNCFKSFDSAKDPSDHFFYATNRKDIVGRKWLRNVQKEWSVLEHGLPDGIYVRVYEDRMDLLRAAIIGPCGTPYQDGLFIFDIHLPAEYPNVPPKVHYHSGGWRLNPNLNEDGTTCLSLLNTFEGKGTEAWVSSSSNILQVLVSIQGLVLNSKPFFNESGYEHLMGSVDGDRSSLDYNENAFVVNCKTMMYLIRRPVKDFEELVRDHFARRGCYILKACNYYREGHLVGSLTKDAEPTVEISDDDQIPTSKGIKLMLDKIIRELFIAFKEVGAHCSEFKKMGNGQELISPLSIASI